MPSHFRSVALEYAPCIRRYSLSTTMTAAAKILCPTRFRELKRRLPKLNGLRVLDVGCGNHSPAITKLWLPGCAYTGVDVAEYNLDAEDRRLMDDFVLVGSDGSGYDALPDESFDIAIMSHVIEHMPDPLSVIATICRKLRRGGYIYLSFPSVRSLALPSAVGATLNFCDDVTHIHIPDVRTVAQTLLDSGFHILRAGRSSDPVRYVIGAALYPCALVRKAFTGRLYGRGLWQFLGFEDMVLGYRRR